MREGATVAEFHKAVIGTAAFYAAVALSCPAVSAEKTATSSVLIVDSSNSMWSQIRGRGRFDITRSVLSRNFSRYSGRFDLGIIAYGHRSKTSCNDIQTIMPVGRIDPWEYSRAIRRLTPKGKTPISRALNAAVKATKSDTAPDNIILLSDGLDNCGPNPCATAAALNSLHADLRVHVIALSVPRNQQARLRCIAENTGGTFVATQSQPGLASATETIFELITEQSEQFNARRLMAMTETASSIGDTESGPPNAPDLSIPEPEGSDTSTGTETETENGTGAAAAAKRKIPIPRANPTTVTRNGSVPDLEIPGAVDGPQPFIPVPDAPRTTASADDAATPQLATMPDVAATPELLMAPEIVTATEILPTETIAGLPETETRDGTAELAVAAAPAASQSPDAAVPSEVDTTLEVTAVRDPAAPPREKSIPELPGLSIVDGTAPETVPVVRPLPAKGETTPAKRDPAPVLEAAGSEDGAPVATGSADVADDAKTITETPVEAAAETPASLEIAAVSENTTKPATPANQTPSGGKPAPEVAATSPVKTTPEPAPAAPLPIEPAPEKPATAKPVVVAAKADPAPATTGAISNDDPTGQKPPAKINLGNRPIPKLPDEVRPTFLINEEPTDAGEEGLRLRGQITSATATITRPIDWTAYKVEDAKADRWRKIASVETAEASISLPPGQYVVRASYGAARAAKVLVVKPGKRIDATFILNAGGLRVVPGLAFLDTPKDISAKHWVFGASANEKGKRRLFAQSTAIGEVVRLNAGTYTLVSRFGNANAVVETNITIRPGTLTEVEINHKVGIVSFRLKNPPDEASGKSSVKWQLVDGKGNIIVRTDGNEMKQILAPGSYRIMVEHKGKSYTSEFMVEIGETKAVEIATK